VPPSPPLWRCSRAPYTRRACRRGGRGRVRAASPPCPGQAGRVFIGSVRIEPLRCTVNTASTPHIHSIYTASAPHPHRISTASTQHLHRIYTATTYPPHLHRICISTAYAYPPHMHIHRICISTARTIPGSTPFAKRCIPKPPSVTVACAPAAVCNRGCSPM
jgi:hypothetical protein